jgi:hypothetical protein
MKKEKKLTDSSHGIKISFPMVFGQKIKVPLLCILHNDSFPQHIDDVFVHITIHLHAQRENTVLSPSTAHPNDIDTGKNKKWIICQKRFPCS